MKHRHIVAPDRRTDIGQSRGVEPKSRQAHAPPGRFIWLMIPTVILCLALVGCRSSSDATEPDHEVPKHKPATFGDAIEEIERRHANLVQSSLDSKPNLNEQELSELLDIIGWLPELAADSPMKKPEWDRANATSKELQSLYESAVRGTKANPGRLEINDQRFVDLCNELKSISDSTER